MAFGLELGRASHIVVANARQCDLTVVLHCRVADFRALGPGLRLGPNTKCDGQADEKHMSKQASDEREQWKGLFVWEGR